MVFNTGETLSSGKGITITNASDWTFEIDSQLISWNKGTKNYSLTTTSSNGIVKTFITGTWTIL